MSHIVRVEAIPLIVPIENPIEAPISIPFADRLAATVFREYRTTIVKVETADGVIGTGECMVRLAPQATAAIVQDVAPILIGEDARDVRRIWELLYGAMMNRGHLKGFYIEALSGIDIALWDIIGQLAGEPVYKVLGGALRDELPVYASSLRFRPFDQIESMIDRSAADGIAAFKIKIGRDRNNPREDLRFAERVRDYVGDDVRLMADANCGYDYGTAVQVGRVLESLDYYWFEEPVTPDDVEGYRRLCTTLDIRIAGGESEFTRYGFRPFFTERAFDIVQPNATRTGGITECMNIAMMASTHGIPYAPHTGSSSAICMSVAVHIAAAIPGFLIFEYMVSDWSAAQPNPLRHELVVDPLDTVTDGQIALPDEPGLGVTLNPDIVARYRVDF